MDDYDIVEFGTDINDSFNIVDGDLTIVEQEDNIVQSILNRLNTSYGELDLFYNTYGGYLDNYMGWKRNDETLRFIELEIETILKQDPRLKNLTITTEYEDKGSISIHLDFSIGEDTDLSLSMVLDNMGNITLEDEMEVL